MHKNLMGIKKAFNGVKTKQNKKNLHVYLHRSDPKDNRQHILSIK